MQRKHVESNGVRKAFIRTEYDGIRIASAWIFASVTTYYMEAAKKFANPEIRQNNELK